MTTHANDSDHIREDRTLRDGSPGVSHCSFTLPANMLASDDEMIDRLLSFAFDVLDLHSVEVRVYEQSDEGERGGH
jgi:hypothetical protein